MAKTAQVKVELNAVDRATRVFQKVGKEADALRGKLDGMSAGAGGLLSSVGAGALGGAVGGFALGGAVQSAAAFEKQLFNLTNVTSEDTRKIKAEMEGLSSSLGSVTALTEGYYQILSAGVSDAAQGMELLTTASQLSAVSGTTQAESINALTKMMAGFRGEIKNTTEAADLLLDIEEYGQSSVRELIPVIGDLAGTSEIAGIKSREMAAGLALITQTAGSTSQAATQFAALANELIKPNEQLAKLIASLGAKSGRELLEKNGLIGSLSLLQQAARASGKEIANFLGSQESIKAFGALAANNFGTLSGIFDQVGTKAGRTQKAFERYGETFESMQAQGLAAFENLTVAFGEGLMPTAKEGIKALTDGMDQSRESAKRFGEEVGNTLSSLMTIVNSIPADAHIAAAGGIVGFRLFGPAGALIGMIPGILSGLGEVLGMMQKMAGFDHIDLGAVDPEDYDLTTAEGAKEYYEAVNRAAQESLQKHLDAVVEEHAKATTKAAAVTSGSPAPAGTPKLPTLPKGFKPVGVSSSSKKQSDAAKAAARAAREEAKNLELVNDVLREVEQKTGQYGIAVESTNRLIEQQAALWRAAGVPEEYIAQLSEIRRLEASTDGLDKMKVGWMEFYTESMDWGTQAGSVLTGTVDTFSASLAEMAMTGKASFSDLARSMASDLTKIAAKMMVVWAIQKALGWATSAIAYQNSLDVMGGPTGAGTDVVSGLGFNAKGGAFAGAGSLHDYSGSVVTRPTLFTAGHRLPQYASGAGLMGEAGPEAVMPLTRVGGRLGVDASGMAPRVNLIINNNASGVDVQTSQRENADGSLDIEATIVRVVNQDMNRRGGLINQSCRKNWGMRSIVTKR